jgi:Helix-turn-helix domain
VQQQIGVGAALRAAREQRGVTLDEASRGTKLRVEALAALEAERFDELMGEVYVRAGLRTYASYLGLKPDRVLSLYTEHAPASIAPPAPPNQIADRAGLTRKRDNHRIAIVVAVTLVILAAGFGLLSASRSAPSPEALGASPSVAPPPGADVVVGVTAQRGLDLVWTADGVEHTLHLKPDETRTFAADQVLTLRLATGGRAEVSVNGGSLGVVGERGSPWQRTFGPASVAGPSVVPTGSAAGPKQGSTQIVGTPPSG